MCNTAAQYCCTICALSYNCVVGEHSQVQPFGKNGIKWPLMLIHNITYVTIYRIECVLCYY